MKEYLSKRVPNYMIPAYFVQMDRIPLTPNGKINYRELSRVSGLQKSQIDYVPPRNPVEKALVNIWETVLNIEQIGIRDSFFSIGGDSIKSIRIISKINKEFNMDFLIADLYEKETIENIARQIDEKQEMGAYTRGASQYDEAYRQALEQVEQLKNSFLANPEQ
jgi:acyl carrier protein